MTVAFWVKSNKTGTSQLTVKDGDNDRICAGTYAISSANTWEHKVINIAADTTGAFNNDNGVGFIFEWWLGGGSSYTSGTAPTAWEARTDADRGANNLSINDNTANDWAITGIQLEVGEYTSSTLPPFQHESYGDNLARCQRYFYRMANENKALGTFSYYSSGRVEAGVHFPVTMRTAPSLVVTSGSSYHRVQRNGGDNNLNDFSAGSVGLTTGSIYNTDEASGTAGNAGYGYTRGSGFVSWDAEL
jgi:hypothetical protein